MFYSPLLAWPTLSLILDSSTGTSYKMSVATATETVITSKTTASVVIETANVPSTYISTGIKTVCTTNSGYGSGYYPA